MNPPLKYHGGKHYLAKKLWGLVDRIPGRKPVHVVEPCCGGAAFTLEGLGSGRSHSFALNDVDHVLMTFWGTLANRRSFRKFLEQCQKSPVSEGLWESARDVVCSVLAAGYVPGDEDAQVQLAHAYFVYCRQSLAGRMTSFAPLSKSRTRRGVNEQASAWWTAVDGLEEVHAALAQVAVLNKTLDAAIASEDSASTLFYCDPPYLLEQAPSAKTYRFVMSREGHVALLDQLAKISGRFILSGYPNELYDRWAEKCGWHWEVFELPNNAAGGKEKRRTVEQVWMNWKPLDPEGECG